MAADDREDEYSTFVPQKLNFEIVPSSGALKFYQHCRPANAVDHNIARRAIFHQILTTCAVLLLTAACGMPIGYSAVLLPQLSTTNLGLNATPEIAIDLEMGSWVASVHSLAMPFGSFLSGPLADYFGRRSTLLLSVLPIVGGWSMLALSQSYPMLIIGRIMCGFANGILGGPAQVYIAETAEPNLRGLLIGAPFVSYSLGILIVYALGSALHWRAVAWCGNILPTAAAVAMFLMPESPAWLLRHHKVEKARKALTFLRGNEIMAQKELLEMSERIKNELATTKTDENIFRLCCHREAIKPLVIVLVFSTLQILSGTYLVVFYAIDIVSEFGADFDTRSAAIWTAVVRIVCTLIFCLVIIFVRRRPMLIISGIGSGLSCLVLSVYMYTSEGRVKSGTDVIVAGSCLLIFIAFNTTLMVMPGIMIGELFPAKIRGRTAGGVFAVMNVSLFILAKAFPLIHLSIRMSGVFVVFGVASLLVSLFMFMFQPETKGRSLDEIEDYFKEKNWLWFNRNQHYKTVQNRIPSEST